MNRSNSRVRAIVAVALAVTLAAPLAARADKTTDANKKLVRRYVEEIANQGKADAADEIIGADYVYHGEGPEGTGPEVVKQFNSMYRTAFPDLHLTIEDMIAEGDRVVVRVTARGTNSGPMMDQPATGKKIEVRSIFIVRIANGKVVEEWENIDELSMMRQLGLMPEE